MQVFGQFVRKGHVLFLYPTDGHSAAGAADGNGDDVLSGDAGQEAARTQVVRVRVGNDAEHGGAVCSVNGLTRIVLGNNVFFRQLRRVIALLVANMRVRQELFD